MVHVVIMAGGIGSRFWPLSTPEYPKQFIDILGCGRTLIQLTADRFQGICPETNFWVVTNEKYVDIVRNQLPTIPHNHILAEPAARNTAPCIAWVSWRILQEDPNANVIVTPSDAVIMNTDEFKRIINNSLDFTKSHDDIVTLGIKPNRPETGYGYIQAGQFVANEICKVKAFKEKPQAEIAKEYLSDGNYFWNAGIFFWNIHTITELIAKYKPNIAESAKEILKTGNIKEIFPKCEKISVDYAVIEPASVEGRVFTHLAEFGWSDLGNWQSLYDKLSISNEHCDDNSNRFVGNIQLVECSNCIVHAEHAKRVVLQGLDGYIVSENEGMILVCKRSEEQRIKDWC